MAKKNKIYLTRKSWGRHTRGALYNVHYIAEETKPAVRPYALAVNRFAYKRPIVSAISSLLQFKNLVKQLINGSLWRYQTV